MDDIEITGGASGIDRRDFIRKSALVGGMVWAAPMVSSLGRPAFAITGTGTQPGTDPGEGSISYVAFIVVNEGTAKFKYEFEDCPNIVQPDSTIGNAPFCNDFPYGGELPKDSDDKYETFEDAYKGISNTGIAPIINTTCPDDGSPWVFTLDANEPYTFDFGVVKSARECRAAEITDGGKTLTANPIPPQ